MKLAFLFLISLALLLDNRLNCLEKVKLNKIIGGYNSYTNTWPWMVSLRQVVEFSTYNGGSKGTYIGEHFCGGTLISTRYILTAAHCVYTRQKKKLVAIIGANNRNESLTFQNTFEIVKITVHKGYQELTKLHDIALLELQYTPSGNNIRAARLPNDDVYVDLIGKNTVIIGWGSINGMNEDKHMSVKLQETSLKVLSNTECSSELSLYKPSSMYCAVSSSQYQKSNLCYGDSGGPMLYRSGSDNWYLYGVSSMAIAYSNYSCNVNRPSYYTKVPFYTTWILETILYSGRN